MNDDDDDDNGFLLSPQIFRSKDYPLREQVFFLDGWFFFNIKTDKYNYILLVENLAIFLI